MPDLAISPEKVCFIIVKAREFDAKVAPIIPDVGSNPSDEQMREVLEDFADDPTYQELVSFLKALSEEETIHLLALLWLGRGDYTLDEWDTMIKEAESLSDARRPKSLLGKPLLSDYLEEGLNQLGYSCEEFEMGRL